MRKASVTSDANGRRKSALRKNGDTGCRNQRTDRRIVSHRRPMCAQHGGERMLDKYKHVSDGSLGALICVRTATERPGLAAWGPKMGPSRRGTGMSGTTGRRNGSGCLAGRSGERVWTPVSEAGQQKVRERGGRYRRQGWVWSAEFGGGSGLRRRDGPAVTAAGAGRLADFPEPPPPAAALSDLNRRGRAPTCRTRSAPDGRDIRPGMAAHFACTCSSPTAVKLAASHEPTTNSRIIMNKPTGVNLTPPALVRSDGITAAVCITSF